jgi:menaquinone-9 beta-reductase
MANKEILIVGGGLAGLISSIHLNRAGMSCCVIEKKTYPFHRVCGEYISNEVLPYLRWLDCDPRELSPSDIRKFNLSAVNGRLASMPLDLGGFGISRYRLDEFLYQKAAAGGVQFHLNTECEQVNFEHNRFEAHTNGPVLNADVVVGSFGKRSRLDGYLHRQFFQKRSPYVGVKYHIRLKDYPANTIALHNFQEGYCGISRVEEDRINLCYLTHRDPLKKFGSIQRLEEAVLFQNPFLRKIFETAEFLFEKPETINEISFETKAPVEQHILMAGDAAGMITPLCGNGMALAIHSAKILSEHILRFCRDDSYSRAQMEVDYSRTWNQLFARRLWVGRQIQRLFGAVWTSNLAVTLAQSTPPIANFLMKKTHGEPF